MTNLILGRTLPGGKEERLGAKYTHMKEILGLGFSLPNRWAHATTPTEPG